MSQGDSKRVRLPKGVSALPRSRGGRAYRATIRQGKRGEVHLGLYETPWLAAFAHGVAAGLLRQQASPAEIPREEQPDADRVRAITASVRRRLGLEVDAPRFGEVAPAPDELLTMFEVTVVGFWRGQAATLAGDRPGAGLDSAAGRLAEAARLLFWSPSAGHPTPLEAMTRLLARRLDQAFRRADLTREVLDDDGDDPWRVARWLVHPDDSPGLRVRGFREEVRYLYPDRFAGEVRAGSGSALPWASILGVTPPFDAERIRAAYRARSRAAHPDAGGSEAEFVRLVEAYEEALEYCASRPS